MPISFEKVQEKAPELLNLVKQSRVELSKQGLDAAKAKVALVLDYSGSMAGTYKSGAMQRLAEKALAIATSFDDDGDIDFFVFDTESAHLGTLSLDNYVGGVDRLRAGRKWGRTFYDKAFYTVRDYFGFNPDAHSGKKSLFGFKKESVNVVSLPAELPIFAIFLTDGKPDSKPAAIKALTEVSKAPIFWKFLSIGADDMEFLQKLDDLEDRFIDNADYQHIGDIDTISDKELFAKLLVEYPAWIKEAKQKGLIK